MLGIKKNDEIIVLAGREKGKKGKVEKVLGKKGTVVVAGVNVYKKHRKDSSGSGIIEVVKPLPVGSVALVCPKCQKITRLGVQILANGSKSRICKKCGEVV